MHKNIKFLLVLILLVSTLKAFEPATYKCYNGGRKSVFTLYDSGSVIQKEYTSRRNKGVWIDFDNEAELTIQSNQITQYLISPDKNGNSSMFIIFTIKNNMNFRFCKAEKIYKVR